MTTPALRAEGVTLGYGGRDIVRDVSVSIPTGGFTAVIGPNGCGKSTLLRSFGRLLRPRSGRVLLGADDLASLGTKAAARRVGLLAQAPTTPSAITVGDLVSRGRTPHHTLLRQWAPGDDAIIHDAIDAVGLGDHADALVEELSGGQRQRAWIAMLLAQQTPVMLLDEPTTYLDVAHQLDVLDLCSHLAADGRTLVAVLHDLSLAARYATHIVAMRDGRVISTGTPHEVLTSETLAAVFDLDARIIPDPETGTPLIIPRDRRPASYHRTDLTQGALS